MTSQLSSAASARLESLLARIYSAVLGVLHIEVAANAIFQAQYLNVLSWVILALSIIPIAGMIYVSWRRKTLGFWPYVHGTTTLLALALWPFVVSDPANLPSDYQPWVWWLVGTATISMGISRPLWLGVSYLFLASIAWYLIDTSIFGGLSPRVLTAQDTIYVFLLGGTVSSLVLLSREAAKKADLANSQAIAEAVSQAQVDASERERQRIDALVHDRVLNTLLTAAQARTESEIAMVKTSALEAIENLERTALDQEDETKITTLGLYRSLRKAALRVSQTIDVEIMTAGLQEIPSEVARALTEATLQALDNAIRHSQATQIRLVLGDEQADGLSIKIIDDGVGFRLDRLPRDRLGISTSIQARVKAVSASALIASEPGVGTSIEFRWSA